MLVCIGNTDTRGMDNMSVVPVAVSEEREREDPQLHQVNDWRAITACLTYILQRWFAWGGGAPFTAWWYWENWEAVWKVVEE